MLGALNQAVQRAPYIPESHNLKGLSWEARGGHQSAIISYKNALHASYALHWPAASNQVVDISVNLARILCKVKANQNHYDLLESHFSSIFYDSTHIILSFSAGWSSL